MKASVRVYLLVEWVGNLTASNFSFGPFVVASTHEALQAEHSDARTQSKGATFNTTVLGL